MGVFDYVNIKYKLPWPEAQDANWQSKTTPAVGMEKYEITEDGKLMHWAGTRRFVEDKADPVLGGHVTLDDAHWAFDAGVNGEIECHHFIGNEWYSVQFWFRDGVIADAIYTKRPIHT